jgi:hypothetical protein
MVAATALASHVRASSVPPPGHIAARSTYASRTCRGNIGVTSLASVADNANKPR